MASDALIFKAAATGVVAVILALAIKRESPAFATIITLAASILIFLMIVPRLSAVLELMTTITDNLSTGSEYVSTALRVIGIAIASEFGASVCADAGESGVAAKVELAGKVLIMAVSAPVVLALLSRVLSLLA